MSSKGSSSLLAQAVKDLNNHWQIARESWNDVKSDEFERKYIESLPGQASQAMAAMEEIDNALKKIRGDCE